MKNYILYTFQMAVLLFCLEPNLSTAQENHEFIPEPMIQRAVSNQKGKAAVSEDPWLQTITEKLNSEPSTEKILQHLAFSDSLKKSLLQSLSSAQLSKKITFKSNKDSITLTAGKLKAKVQILNPARELFLVNDYEINLFGKTEQERLIYLVKVLKYTVAKPSQNSWFSFLISEAHAESQLFLIEDSELTALGIGVDAVTSESKAKACQEAQQNFQQSSAASKAGFLDIARKNIASYASGDESLAQKSEGNPQALKVAVSFWCESQTLMQKPITNFHVKCSEKNEIDSISYAACTPKGEATPVGFIRKTKGSYWFGTSASKIAETAFGKSSFIKNIESCCAEKTANCVNQINQIAPIAADPSQQNNVHDRIDSRTRSAR